MGMLEKLSLEYIVREPQIKLDKPPLLILLHGYGSNEEDLFSFASELPKELLILSVRAPHILSFGAYAWYAINFDALQGKFSDIPEAIKSRELIATFIKEVQAKYSISPNNTFLLGFSQGTVLSYAVALKYPELTQKVIALSGYIMSDLLPEEIKELDYTHLDFFISHGKVDQVIPREWACKAPGFLDTLNVKNCYTEYPVGHGVAPANFFDFKSWIENRMIT